MNKLDIRNTYIENDHGELRDLYLRLAKEQNIAALIPNPPPCEFIECDFIKVGSNESHAIFSCLEKPLDSKKLTIKQLRAHFGIGGDAAEWDGEGLPPVGAEIEIMWTDDSNPKWYRAKVHATFKNDNAFDFGVVFCEDGYYQFSLGGASNAEIRPIETPAKKAERERLEAAYDLYCSTSDALAYPAFFDFDEFKAQENTAKFYCAIVDKTGYRKEKDDV